MYKNLWHTQTESSKHTQGVQLFTITLRYVVLRNKCIDHWMKKSEDFSRKTLESVWGEISKIVLIKISKKYFSSNRKFIVKTDFRSY